ncbi:MAG: hypothetical protein R3F60_14245 [bacterium]
MKKLCWLLSAAVLLPWACVPSSDGDDGGHAPLQDAAQATDAAVPAGPTTKTPSPDSARFFDYEIPNVGDGGAADLCFDWDGASPLDPRRGVSVGRCVDTLIIRFVVLDGQGTGRALVNPNFNGLAVTVDDAPVGAEALPLDTPLDVTVRTIPNLLAGGLRLELTFEVTLTANDLTVGDVTFTPLP